jgi:SAM-dependent methyltransferase
MYKYIEDSIDLKFLKSAFLRNKNATILPFKSSLLTKVISLLQRILEKSIDCSIMTGGYKLVVSEQIIENALAIQLLNSHYTKILDFGGYESWLPLSLSALGFKITVLDKRPYPFRHPNINVVCSDIFDDNEGIGGPFDAIVSISTIEHLGLGYYGDKSIQDGDRKAVEYLWKNLREGGRLIASVPAGKPIINRGYRVYDQKRLNFVFPHATEILFFRKQGREAIWERTQPEAIVHIEYSDPIATMPVEAIAFIVCDKK